MTSAEWKTKGNAAFASKNYLEAIDYFTKGIEVDPENAVLYSNRSGAFASMGQFQNALEDAEKCISIKPDWSKGYSRKGLAEYQLGKIADAVNSYKAGLNLEPNNEALKNGLMQAEAADPATRSNLQVRMMVASLLQSPKFKKYAEEDTQFGDKLIATLTAVIQDPKSLEIAMALAPDSRIKEALRVLLHLPEDIAETEAASTKKPEAPKKSDEDLKKGNLSKSAEEKEADTWKEKGNAFYKAKQFKEAIEAYEKAHEIYPNTLTYQLNKAAVYLELKDYEKCLSECDNALNRRYEVRADYEQVAKVYNRMATCYRRMEDYTKAIAMYEKSLMEFNTRHIRAALSETKVLKDKKDREMYMNPELAEKHRLAGNEFFKNGSYPDAKKEYDEAIRRAPQDPRVYANRSAALMKLLELPMALKDAETSLELDPTVAKVWARKGNIHMLMKEYNKALTAYQKGLERDSESIECRKGMDEVLRKIQETTSSDKVDEEQIKHAMADPEIQGLLADPQFRLLLSRISEDPSRLTEAMKDPLVAANIQKLMAAGILKVN